MIRARRTLVSSVAGTASGPVCAFIAKRLCGRAAVSQLMTESVARLVARVPKMLSWRW